MLVESFETKNFSSPDFSASSIFPKKLPQILLFKNFPLFHITKFGSLNSAKHFFWRNERRENKKNVNDVSASSTFCSNYMLLSLGFSKTFKQIKRAEDLTVLKWIHML